MPEAAFYLWLPTPVPDTEFARRLYASLQRDGPARQLSGARSARRQSRAQASCASRWCPPRTSALEAASACGILATFQLTGTTTMTELQRLIDAAFENRASITPANADPRVREAVAAGARRSSTPASCGWRRRSTATWTTHQWIKKAVLLSFRLEDNAVVRDGYTNYFDKVPAKFAAYGAQDFKAGGFRVVPPAAVRRGAFIARNVVLMPSYVNIGAYVDEATMVDTWATVGSCAQIGKNVHLSGGVGIGGVLEPVQANPTIIEDNCFIGARSRSSRA